MLDGKVPEKRTNLILKLFHFTQCHICFKLTKLQEIFLSNCSARGDWTSNQSGWSYRWLSSSPRSRNRMLAYGAVLVKVITGDSIFCRTMMAVSRTSTTKKIVPIQLVTTFLYWKSLDSGEQRNKTCSGFTLVFGHQSRNNCATWSQWCW